MRMEVISEVISEVITEVKCVVSSKMSIRNTKAAAAPERAASVADFNDSPFVALLKRENARVAQTGSTIAFDPDEYKQVRIQELVAQADELYALKDETGSPEDSKPLQDEIDRVEAELKLLGVTRIVYGKEPVVEEVD